MSDKTTVARYPGISTFQVEVDSRGRVTFSREHRSLFGDTVYAVIQRDTSNRPYIAVITPSEFGAWADDCLSRTSANTPETAHRRRDPHLREERREFFANAAELSFDSQHRLLLPKLMRTQARIFTENNVWLRGVEDGVEIWPAADQPADCAQREPARNRDASSVEAPAPENPPAQS